MSEDLLIDLLRHGEVEGHGRIYGSTDVALSETGREQMEAATTKGSWHGVYSSPLQRCAHFANSLAEKKDIPFHIEPNLAELNFGEWEGGSIEEIMHAQPGMMEAYWQDPTSRTPENAEPINAFALRVTEVVERLTTTHKSEHLLLVTHGGVIRVLLAWALAMPLAEMMRMEVAHAGMSRIRIPSSGKPSLVFHGGGALC